MDEWGKEGWRLTIFFFEEKLGTSEVGVPGRGYGILLWPSKGEIWLVRSIVHQIGQNLLELGKEKY